MKYAYAIGMNAIAAALIGAGCHGCSGGHTTWGWCIVAGLGLLTEVKTIKTNDAKDEVTP